MKSFGSKPAITVHKESCRKEIMVGYEENVLVLCNTVLCMQN
jgi:hypothetical protein